MNDTRERLSIYNLSIQVMCFLEKIMRMELKVMNKKLQRLTKAVKYTSMADIWAEIEEGSHDKADKKTIVKDCMNRWKRNGKIK